jgi:hypothetical protein
MLPCQNLQCKMSMKLAKKRGRFPCKMSMKMGGGIGVARPGASAHVECREPQPGTDPGSSEPIEFAGCGREKKDAWVQRVLESQRYGELSKRERGVVRAYVDKVTGTSAPRCGAREGAAR